MHLTDFVYPVKHRRKFYIVCEKSLMETKSFFLLDEHTDKINTI